jgi:hypothetical protein
MVLLIWLDFPDTLGVWALVDFIIAVSGNEKDSEEKLIRNW